MLMKVAELFYEPDALIELLPDLFFTSVGASVLVAGASVTRLVDLSSRSIATFYAFQLSPGDLVSPGKHIGDFHLS